MQARQFLLHKPEEQQQEEQQQNDESSLLDEIRDLVDPQRVVAAGYSYGAATVAQTVTQIVKAQQQRQQQEKVSASDDEQEEKKNDAHSSCMQNLGSDFPFQAAMFLDGWFHIDVQKSAGIEFESPPEAFAYIDASDDDDDNDNNKWPVPSLFVDSQQFQGFSKLFKATKRLARAANTKVTVLANTGHQNFCDVIFWLPLSILQILMMGAVGETDPLKAYQDMLDHTQDFLNEKVGKVRSRDR